MARGRGLVSSLYLLARLGNDASTLASGNPEEIARWAKGKPLGRTIERLLFK